MQLTHITIKNVRAVEGLDLDLSAPDGGPRRRVVLLGANGAGKTTILDSVAHAYQKLAEDDTLGAKLLGLSDVHKAAPPSAGAPLPPRTGAIRFAATLSADEHASVRARLLPGAPAHGPLGFDVGGLPSIAGNGRTFISSGKTAFRESARAALIANAAFAPCVLLPSNRASLGQSGSFAFREVADFSPRSLCLSKLRKRFVPLAARLALAFMGSDPDGTIGRMWKVLAKYFPELPRPIHVSNLQIWFETGDKSVVPLSALSDGERAVILLFAEIAMRSPRDGVVLIDEVEQHLHPRWQRAVLDALPALAPTAQFIITTQAPYVAACAPDDTIEVGDWKRHGE